MKVFWFSDGGSHTGFARVTHAIGDRLVEKYGHDVYCLATNYQGDYWPSKIKLYRPNKLLTQDVYGKSRVIEMLSMEPDVVVMVNDPALVVNLIFDNQYDTEKYLAKYRPILSYMPIDGHNQPPPWDVLRHITKRVAMTKFGQAYMPEAPLVYHGVDTDDFWPVSRERPITSSTGITVTSKRECKEALSYPKDSFLVLRVDRNSGRKDFGASWKALVPVMKRHDDIHVHFHCQGVGDAFGVDMRAIFSRSPETKDRFYLPDQLTTFLGWSQEDLNLLYNAADLFITTSRGEGFGLTIAEALACGVPVVAQNVSAIPEVVGPGGVLLEPEREITVPSGQDLWLADIPAFTEAIEHLYLSAGARRDLGAKGREHVTKSFSWDFAAARFDEYLRELAEGTGTSGGVDAVQQQHGTPDQRAVEVLS